MAGLGSADSDPCDLSTAQNRGNLTDASPILHRCGASWSSRRKIRLVSTTLFDEFSIGRYVAHEVGDLVWNWQDLLTFDAAAP